MPTGNINRADVAAVCVEALSNPGASKVTVEVVAKQGLPEGGYSEQLSAMWRNLKQGVA